MKKKNIKKLESIFLTALLNNKNSQITLPKIETEKTTKLRQADVSKYLEETGLEQILSVTERGDDMETKRKLKDKKSTKNFCLTIKKYMAKPLQKKMFNLSF